jgi:hypothetical protein
MSIAPLDPRMNCKGEGCANLRTLRSEQDANLHLEVGEGFANWRTLN